MQTINMIAGPSYVAQPIPPMSENNHKVWTWTHKTRQYHLTISHWSWTTENLDLLLFLDQKTLACYRENQLPEREGDNKFWSCTFPYVSVLQIQSQSLISLPDMLAKSCAVYTFAFITPCHSPLICKSQTIYIYSLSSCSKLSNLTTLMPQELNQQLLNSKDSLPLRGNFKHKK